MNLNKIKKKVNYSLVQKEITTTNFQIINSSLVIKQEGSNSYKSHTVLKFPEILKKAKVISNSNLKDKTKKLSSSTFKKYNKTTSNENKKQLIGNLSLNSFQNQTIIVNSLENTKLNSIFFSFIQLKSFFFKMPQDKKDAWKIKHNDIYSLINFNALFSLNLFPIYQHFDNKKMSKTIDI